MNFGKKLGTLGLSAATGVGGTVAYYELTKEPIKEPEPEVISQAHIEQVKELEHEIASKDQDLKDIKEALAKEKSNGSRFAEWYNKIAEKFNKLIKKLTGYEKRHTEDQKALVEKTNENNELILKNQELETKSHILNKQNQTLTTIHAETLQTLNDSQIRFLDEKQKTEALIQKITKSLLDNIKEKRTITGGEWTDTQFDALIENFIKNFRSQCHKNSHNFDFVGSYNVADCIMTSRDGKYELNLRAFQDNSNDDFLHFLGKSIEQSYASES